MLFVTCPFPGHGIVLFMCFVVVGEGTFVCSYSTGRTRGGGWSIDAIFGGVNIDFIGD